MNRTIKHRHAIFSIIVLLSWLSLANALNKREFSPTGPQPYVINKYNKRIPIYNESHALLISASKYKGYVMQGWRELPNTLPEVDEIQKVLQQHGFHVVRIHDPTGSDLNQAYRDFVAKYGLVEQNRLLFLFAGHGYTRNDGYGYIVPIDASDPNIDPEGFYQKAKPIKDLVTIAEELSAKHALFIFDSCFSGSIFATRGSEQPPAPRGTSQERELFFLNAAQQSVRQFITAGNENQKVPDNPLFGQILIKGLNGMASPHKDGYVTGKELGLWLEHIVPQYSEIEQFPHSDLIKNTSLIFGDMIFQPPTSLSYAKEIQPKPNYNNEEPQAHTSTSRAATKSIPENNYKTQGTEEDQFNDDESDWFRFAKEGITGLEFYIKLHPNGAWASEAHTRLKRARQEATAKELADKEAIAREKAATKEATRINPAPREVAPRELSPTYGTGRTLTAQDQDQINYEWQKNIQHTKNSQTIEKFLKDYPTGSHVPAALQRLEELRAHGR